MLFYVQSVSNPLSLNIYRPFWSIFNIHPLYCLFSTTYNIYTSSFSSTSYSLFQPFKIYTPPQNAVWFQPLLISAFLTIHSMFSTICNAYHLFPFNIYKFFGLSIMYNFSSVCFQLTGICASSLICFQRSSIYTPFSLTRRSFSTT